MIEASPSNEKTPETKPLKMRREAGTKTNSAMIVSVITTAFS
jgi:hypothetical protein